MHLRFASVVGVSLLATAACAPQFDLVIKNGDLIDGTGAPARRADVAVRGDRIVAVGAASGRARRTIDATGHVVAPGFIDVQGQSGVTLLVDANGESHIRQGITTEIIGEGSTPALWTRDTADRVALDRYHLQYDWTGFDGYLHTLQNRGTSTTSGRSRRSRRSASRSSACRTVRPRRRNCSASRRSSTARCSRAPSVSRPL